MNAYLLRTCSILLLSAALIAPGIVAHAESDKEYAVEVAFVYQFTNYFEWPSDAANGPTFVIAVVGESPLLEHFERLAHEKTVKGKKIEVRRAADASKVGQAAIVVLATQSSELLKEVAKATKGTGTLVVDYAENAAKNGAAVNFFEQDGRLRFEINRATVESQKLKVSSQLLNLARLVE